VSAGPLSFRGDGDASSICSRRDDSAAYERLRACVLDQAAQVTSAGRHAAGLGLVLLNGVPGWLNARAGVGSMANDGSAIQEAPRPNDFRVLPACARAHSITGAVPPEILPFTHQSDLTLLIASMVVSTQRTRRACSTGALIARGRFQEGVACR